MLPFYTLLITLVFFCFQGNKMAVLAKDGLNKTFLYKPANI